MDYLLYNILEFYWYCDTYKGQRSLIYFGCFIFLLNTKFVDILLLFLLCHAADERYINPQQEKFSIQLISPVSWEAIPNTR